MKLMGLYHQHLFQAFVIFSWIFWTLSVAFAQNYLIM